MTFISSYGLLFETMNVHVNTSLALYNKFGHDFLNLTLNTRYSVTSICIYLFFRLLFVHVLVRVI